MNLPGDRAIYPGDAIVAAAVKMMPKLAGRLRIPPGLRLPELAIQLWRERPDLQAAFDPAGTDGRQRLALWLVFHGFGETCLALDGDVAAAMAPWHQPWPALASLTDVPISWLMREAGRRNGFTVAELRTSAGQHRLVSWYFRIAMTRYNWLTLLTDRQAATLAEKDTIRGIARIMLWLWDADPKLEERFGSPDDPAWREWLYEHGAARWPLLADPRIGLARGNRRVPDRSRPFGVNLVGHARARLGVGEDVRMAARTLAAAGIPFTIRDLPAGGDIVAEDASVDRLVADTMPYLFTLVCTTGPETVRAVNLFGQHAFDGQIVIGFWPWELPEFPRLWRPAYGLVDEVWASSRYTHDAYARSARVPVRHMPMAVTVDDRDGLGRADFNLPADQFLFLFAYDALSHTARKNPQACLAAFDRAFPQGDEPVGLVIKGLRASASPAWQELAARAAADPRLHLVENSLAKGSLLDLYRSCDCFVSLHRAEGFGRNIAESMGLGRPVIVTAHSGNMDFTQWDTAALVPVDLCGVRDGQYPFAAGQVWAEPIVEEAACLMRRMVADADWRDRIARNGARRIAELYAPAIVGRQWAAALHELHAGRTVEASSAQHDL